jgi:methyl-accepting chemotaxis protein
MSTAPTAGPIVEPEALPPQPQGGARNRRLRNYLLDTGLQLKLASYLIGVAVLLSAFLGWKLYQAWRETSQVIALNDPETADALAQALATEDRGRIVVVSAALIFILLMLLGAAIVITHRIAGPAFALGRTCRRVADGDLTPPRPLRDGDLLVDLAGDVASMVDALRAREALEREVLARGASRLRAGATPAEAGAVASELEALAKEKGIRIGS